VHRRYVASGCDVISTHTWAITNAPSLEPISVHTHQQPMHWMDIARKGVRLARQAIDEAGKTDQIAVAFSLNGDVERPEQQGTLELLTRVFESDPPDLILMETLSLIRDNMTFPAVEVMLQTGIPVWLSFRRCRHGVCSIYGHHWGGPEGDLFGRAARQFEKMGVKALMINCLPIDHVTGMIPWLRDFTDLPLGAYPNSGRYLDPGWKFDDSMTPERYADYTLQWRSEGAQILGGCCGTTPQHIAAAKQALADSKRGHPQSISTRPGERIDVLHVDQPVPQPWQDDKGRVLYPLQFPEIVVDRGVFHPTQGSFLIWKFLFESRVGARQRCLDVGCGSGLLSIQMALNGAEHVHAIDIQREAVANTLANAFRNGVSDHVSGADVDLYSFMPEEKYDVIVASLYQMPVDPMGEITGHRAVDFWGRNLLDHLIWMLPNTLADGGTAYIMQVSILSQLQTAQKLEEAGLSCKVIDFAFFHFSPIFYENMAQIEHVEQISDAYHLKFSGADVMVMYLLEVKRIQ
jgi:homocysteine S-methyltransferase